MRIGRSLKRDDASPLCSANDAYGACHFKARPWHWHRPDMPEMPVVFDRVTMLAASPLGRTFRIGDKNIFVGSAVPLKGTAAFIVGQVGRLVLPLWFVETHGLQGSQVMD